MFEELTNDLDVRIALCRSLEMREIIKKLGLVWPMETPPEVSFDCKTAEYKIFTTGAQAESIAEHLRNNGFNVATVVEDNAPYHLTVTRNMQKRNQVKATPKVEELPFEVKMDIPAGKVVRVHRRTNRNGAYITVFMDNGDSAKYNKAPDGDKFVRLNHTYNVGNQSNPFLELATEAVRELALESQVS